MWKTSTLKLNSRLTTRKKMKNKIFLLFAGLACLGCQREIETETVQSDSLSQDGHTSNELLMESEAADPHDAPIDSQPSIGLSPNTPPTLSDANADRFDFLPWDGFPLDHHKLTRDQINKIDENVTPRREGIDDPEFVVASAEQALRHIRSRTSIIKTPRTVFESDDYFYFSGGITDRVVNDFSQGMRVTKQGGEIMMWTD